MYAINDTVNSGVKCPYVFPPYVAGATPPTNLTADPVDPTSIKVSWTRPTSGAAVTGYCIYYRALGSVPYHGSVDVGANKTHHIVSNLREGFVYIITMVTRSQYLPSSVTAPIRATLGKIYTRQDATSVCMGMTLAFSNLFFPSYGEQCNSDNYQCHHTTGELGCSAGLIFISLYHLLQCLLSGTEQSC